MPAVGRSVQFRGIDNAVKAYTNMQIPRWGLFQGSQFLMKYEGKDMKEGADLLDEYLNALDLRSADANTYTLCIYDNAEKINNATKYDASFNFRLVDNIDGYNQSKSAGMYEARIAGLEKQIEEMTAEEVEEQATPAAAMWAAMGRILEHPDVQTAIARKILGVIDGLGDTVGAIFKPAGRSHAIGSAPQAPADENESLQQAINILAPIDPKLGTHLLQLAKIAERDPGKYNNLISMLNLAL